MHNTLISTLRGIGFDVKKNIAISWVEGPCGEKLVVSSYYSDTWDFSPKFPHAARAESQKKISWKRCEPGWDEVMREILTAFFLIRRPKGERIGAHILPSVFNVLNPIFRWFSNKGVSRLEDVTAIHLKLYIGQLKKTQKSRTIYNKVAYIKRIFEMREYLNSSFTESAILALQDKDDESNLGDDATQTKVIPFPALAALFQKAITELREAELVFRLKEHYESVSEEPLSDELLELKRRIHLSTKHKYFGVALEVKLVTLRTAVYIIIATCTGCRIHELADIKVGCFYSETINGEEHFWLQSNTRKTADGPQRWLAPSIAGWAIEILTRLTSQHRESVKLKLEELNRQYNNSEPGNKKTELAVTISVLKQHSQRLFLAELWDGSIVSLSNSAHNDALASFCDYANVELDSPLRTHRFRRTYAAVIVRLGKGVSIDLITLQYHFKHSSLLMTEGYTYLSDSDRELLQLIDEEADAFDSELVSGWLEPGAKLAGGLGLRIKRYVREGHKPITFASRKEFVSSIRQGLTIRGTGHSWCLAEEDGCGGQGLFEAERCTDCANGVIDENHRKIWRGIREQQDELLQLNDIGAPALSKVRVALKKAEDVLATLSGGERNDSAI